MGTSLESCSVNGTLIAYNPSGVLTASSNPLQTRRRQAFYGSWLPGID